MEGQFGERAVRASGGRGPTVDCGITWTEISRARSCPICGGEKGCAISEDGRFASCLVVPSVHPMAESGWLHVLAGTVAVARTQGWPTAVDGPATAGVEGAGTRLQTVLVPLDGTPLAECALPYAAWFARTLGGGLVLVRVVGPRSRSSSDSEPAQRFAESVVSVARRLRAGGLTVEQVLRAGEPAGIILATDASVGADLIVMATHGRTGIDRWLHGSVADDVLRRADVPVLLVTCGMKPIWPPDGPLRILVPLDGSDLADEALLIVEQLAARVEVDVLLLRVLARSARDPSLQDRGPALAAEASAADARARNYLAGVAARLRSVACGVDLLVEMGDAPSVIAEVARERSAHLIAMTMHARGRLARLLLGSVATGVLKGADVPLLLVPPGHNLAADAAPTVG